VSLVGAEQVAEQRLFSRKIAVALIIFALTTSLAGRVVHGTFFKKTAVHSSSSLSEKVQHRDRDGAEWAPPVADLALLWVAEPSLHPELTRQVYLQLHYECLYNRPPPIS
jgi:hypothetical protein